MKAVQFDCDYGPFGGGIRMSVKAIVFPGSKPSTNPSVRQSRAFFFSPGIKISISCTGRVQPEIGPFLSGRISYTVVKGVTKYNAGF